MRGDRFILAFACFFGLSCTTLEWGCRGCRSKTPSSPSRIDCTRREKNFLRYIDLTNSLRDSRRRPYEVIEEHTEEMNNGIALQFEPPEPEKSLLIATGFQSVYSHYDYRNMPTKYKKSFQKLPPTRYKVLEGAMIVISLGIQTPRELFDQLCYNPVPRSLQGKKIVLASADLRRPEHVKELARIARATFGAEVKVKRIDLTNIPIDRHKAQWQAAFAEWAPVATDDSWVYGFTLQGSDDEFVAWKKSLSQFSPALRRT